MTENFVIFRQMKVKIFNLYFLGSSLYAELVFLHDSFQFKEIHSFFQKISELYGGGQSERSF